MAINLRKVRKLILCLALYFSKYLYSWTKSKTKSNVNGQSESFDMTLKAKNIRNSSEEDLRKIP